MSSIPNFQTEEAIVRGQADGTRRAVTQFLHHHPAGNYPSVLIVAAICHGTDIYSASRCGGNLKPAFASVGEHAEAAGMQYDEIADLVNTTDINSDAIALSVEFLGYLIKETREVHQMGHRYLDQYKHNERLFNEIYTRIVDQTDKGDTRVLRELVPDWDKCHRPAKRRNHGVM